ncbi:leucine-rich repeat receptor protein kinase EMS1 [Magnolia sinica]|uniref:leucine-rich repeat receptor protein kinase EMS1 n=1 Tax=Magnolia sinica TaxID=86752 RepID=UPI0026597367|nr:leucine-rich repeat receptor protein kinase EMS1 [Magnolia sinica]
MDPTLQALTAAAASFIAVTFIFTIILFLCRRDKTHHGRRQQHQRRRQRQHQQQQQQQLQQNKHNPNSTLDESASFDPSLNQISMPELIAATRNFAADGIIGDGSFGFVYKANLSNGVTVAVKKLSRDAFQGPREFRAEMETLGKIEHQNLVKMKGYCVSGEERLLIYEFIQRGSLDQWLHDISSMSITSISSSQSSSASLPNLLQLSWAKRIKIIKGVANGLRYLHDECNPRIIHRDIKASNVLLDLEFEAHIADFGLARIVDASHSHVSTQVAGTMGYMPPEYKDGLTGATVKADVYSFGILMLEVATGRRPNLPVMTENGKEVGLIVWARERVEAKRCMDMIDPIIKDELYHQHQGREEGMGSEEEEVNEFFRIAYLCTSENPRERPTMEDALSQLSRF